MSQGKRPVHIPPSAFSSRHSLASILLAAPLLPIDWRIKILIACTRAQVSRLQAHADEEAFWQRGEALATKVGRAHACLSA